MNWPFLICIVLCVYAFIGTPVYIWLRYKKRKQKSENQIKSFDRKLTDAVRKKEESTLN